jgi:hypothetical protein
MALRAALVTDAQCPFPFPQQRTDGLSAPAHARRRDRDLHPGGALAVRISKLRRIDFDLLLLHAPVLPRPWILI